LDHGIASEEVNLQGAQFACLYLGDSAAFELTGRYNVWRSRWRQRRAGSEINVHLSLYPSASRGHSRPASPFHR
jgi:hypothetical protein